MRGGLFCALKDASEHPWLQASSSFVKEPEVSPDSDKCPLGLGWGWPTAPGWDRICEGYPVLSAPRGTVRKAAGTHCLRFQVVRAEGEVEVRKCCNKRAYPETEASGGPLPDRPQTRLCSRLLTMLCAEICPFVDLASFRDPAP